MPPKNIEETQEGSQGGINTVVADLQRQIHDLQDQLVRGVPLKKIERVTKHEARIMLYEGRPVIKFGSAYKKTVNGEEVLFVNIVTNKEDGKEKEHAIEYLKLLNESPRILCSIQKSERSTKELPQGRVAQQVRVSVSKSDPVGISGQRDFSRRDVEMTETIEHIEATIKIEEGDLKGLELTLPAEALNP